MNQGCGAVQGGQNTGQLHQRSVPNRTMWHSGSGGGTQVWLIAAPPPPPHGRPDSTPVPLGRHSTVWHNILMSIETDTSEHMTLTTTHGKF